MIISKKILIKITSENFNHFKQLGYHFPNRLTNNIILISDSDLPKDSEILVFIRCEKCSKASYIEFNKYNGLCLQCQGIKKETKNFNIDKDEVQKYQKIKDKNFIQKKRDEFDSLIKKLKLQPSKELYQQYLKTNYWKLLRISTVEKNSKCKNCGSSKNLHIHHNSYENLGTIKEKEDLITLCELYHKKIHNLLDISKERKLQLIDNI